MELLTEEKLRVLLLKDRSSGATIRSQCEDMSMGYHTLMNWSRNILRYPYRANCPSIRILQYLQEQGYLTVIIHKEKLPY